MDWEEWCAERDGPPHICNECGAAFDPTDNAGIREHHEEHWYEWLRAQCPIPPYLPSSIRPRPVIADDDPDVPF